MVGMELPLMIVDPARLSSFCKISSDTSFSELINGTTSSCNATFLNSTLDELANAVVGAALPVVVGALKVLTGMGISVPEAIIAFLLLLVKTIGREITL